MCGIIGVVNSQRCSGEPLPVTAVWDTARELQEAPTESAGKSLALLDRRIDSLFMFSSLFMALKDRRRSSSILLETAALLLSRAEEWEASRKRAARLDEQEKFSALALQARDLSWRLQRDFVPNLERIEELARGDVEKKDKIHACWQINIQLKGMDRLEVRGRDSAGIVVALTFNDWDAYRAFRADVDTHPETSMRIDRPDFGDRAIRVHEGRRAIWYFAFKIAREIGEMGSNVQGIRERIIGDDVFHRALDCPNITALAMAHTRWASNGVISEPNCHPLDNYRQGTDAGSPVIIAALNGDIDNFQELREEAESTRGGVIPPSITTDARIIPVWIERYLEDGHDFGEAFRRAVNDFSGSMAIAVQTSIHPGRVYLAQRGSGQSLYIGETGDGLLFASELYGLVEETRRFIKMDGERERVPGDPSSMGQIAILDAGLESREDDPSFPSLRLFGYDGVEVSDIDGLKRTAEITTRDIDRGGYSHFMLKEISEAASSFRKTIQGKYTWMPDGRVAFPFIDDVLPSSLRRALERGEIRRLYCIGQGTAALAAEGIAALTAELIAETGIDIRALKATELSGFGLRRNMSDTWVIAVSQSGTTTDTNRTVDMVRERGGHVIGIVNRRNSDLVYKADGVLYTSDGRDVEMSVASTKAFYAQIAAGYILALGLAKRLGTISEALLRQELANLERIPGWIERILRERRTIEAVARRHAIRHRHWAVVGNGLNRVAAGEIRIKLSELCYKSIACDHTEDKKHIDLSSEPLIVVCAAGLGAAVAGDVAKEVAIFKAHKACPLVITEEGEESFHPYAEDVMTVPPGAGRLSFVLATVVGHLWGYYAARALDEQAASLRRLRADSVALEASLRNRPLGAGTEALISAFRAQLSQHIQKIHEALLQGDFNSGLTASSALRLSQMLHTISGRLHFDDLVLEVPSADGGLPSLFERYLSALTSAINDLTRPIDAIKHQAKTVTVGISRDMTLSGVIFEYLDSLGIDVGALLPSHIETLQALTPLVSEVRGSVEYQLAQLNSAGDPTEATRLRVKRKTGIAERLPSRADQWSALKGSKRLIASHHRLLAGAGSLDARPLIMFPLVNRGKLNGLLLLHVRFDESADEAARRRALRVYRQRYEELIGMITEQNIEWTDDMLTRIPIPELFEGSSDAILQSLGMKSID